MTTPTPTPLSEVLDRGQLARIAAASAARDLLRGTEGMLKSPAPSLEDIVNLAHFFLTGSVDPGVFLPDYPEDDDQPDWWAGEPALLVRDDAIHLMVPVPDDPWGFWTHTHECLPDGNDPTLHCDPTLTVSSGRMKMWLARPSVHAEATNPPTTPEEEPSDD